jgi:PAS domain S-box-containing protein
MEKSVKERNELETKLKKAESDLEQLSMKKTALEKAIWDLLNHANIFVLLLDHRMNILLINHSFSVKLGFNNPKELIGKCWLDFIKPEEHDRIAAIHHELAFKDDEEEHKYREVVNDIIKPNGKVCTIKWFNFSVNHEYNLTFSIGIPKEVPTQVTEDSIRNYYQHVLEKDKTMITSLRDTVIKGLRADKVCNDGGF